MPVPATGRYFLVGFVAALRRSEITGIDVDQIADHESGLVLQFPRSKTNQRGTPTNSSSYPALPACPLLPRHHPADLAAARRHTDGPAFRAVSKGNRALDRRLTPAAVNDILRTAVGAADLDAPETYSAHSLRAGFVTYTHASGATDRLNTTDLADAFRLRDLAPPEPRNGAPPTFGNGYATSGADYPPGH